MNRLRGVNKDQLQKSAKQDCDSEMNTVLFLSISGKYEEFASYFQEMLLKNISFFLQDDNCKENAAML